MRGVRVFSMNKHPMVLAARVFLAVCAAASSLVSCTAARPSVGLFLYNESDPYIREFARQIGSSMPARFTLTTFDAGNSQPIQNDQIESMLSGRYKPVLVMINPVDRLASYAIIQRLKEAGIPIIFFNREPLLTDLQSWSEVCYVGARAEQSGQLQARLVMSLFGGKPGSLNEYDRNRDGVIQTILFKGEQGHQDAEIRTREVLSAFESRGFAIQVLALEVANWNQDQAYERTGNLLRDHDGKIELIISNNDAMALGAISRLRQAGAFRDTNGNGKVDRGDAGWIPVVGIDGLREAEEAILQGFLYGTVRNDSASMARAMVERALIMTGSLDPASAEFPLQDGSYIWIDYRPYSAQ